MTAYAWSKNDSSSGMGGPAPTGSPPPAQSMNGAAASASKDLSEDSTSSLARTLIFVLRLCLLAVLGVVIWLNIQPYIGMMNELFGNQGGHPLVQFVMRLPGIGHLLRLIQSIFLSIIGVMLWGFFQVLELMPSVMNTNSGLKKMIFGLSNQRTIPVNNNDPPMLRQMKVRYNRKPQAWMRKAVIAASVAYLADLLFCLFYYPPIEGGMVNLMTFLLAPSADQIDWRNLALAGVTLFSVEVAVWIYMWLAEGKNYMIGTEKA